ncbi:hypothetical protein KOEU_05140 [Komagataeibacter europaeus]|uniref:Major facilitator superfamily protein n=1 Tax=Komagataeibacter europaeus TaxID=33995 RepID=A0A0M0EKP0_KOMEU|nr:MFS transporter [Komagataeibacter europaeus]KON65827.1 hypothetical protein KOEU_05140 [Komagataeibacter europaeus]
MVDNFNISSSSTRDNIRLAVSASIGSGISHLGSTMMPFQTNSLIEGFHISASAAGMFGFFEISSLSLAMLMVVPFLGAPIHGRLAFGGALIVIAAQIMIYLGPSSVPYLWGCSILSGCGFGVIFSAFISRVSAIRNPDRIYSISCGGGAVVTVSTVMTIPWTTAWLGQRGPFMSIILVVAVLMPFLSFLGHKNNDIQKKKPLKIEWPGYVVGTIPILIMWAGYSIGSGIVWSFVDGIGQSIHVKESVIVLLSSAGIIAGFLSNVFGAVIAGHINRRLPLLFGIIGTALSFLLTGLAWNTVIYCFGIISYWIFVMIAYAYLLGAAAGLDPTGKVGAMGGSCDRIAYAVGALMGGFLVDVSSYSMLGIAGFISCIMTLPVCMPLVSRAFHNHAVARDQIAPTLN